MWDKFLRYFHTIRHLRLIQIRYRIFFWLRRKWWKMVGYPSRDFSKYLNSQKQGLPIFQPGIAAPIGFLGENRFRFLNIEHDFGKLIDWEFRENGHLWIYNLHYFDWLNQPGLSAETGLFFIRDFIQRTTIQSVGFEPFPTSLRLISWIKFLVQNKLEDPEITAEIHGQANWLCKNLEYHLLANHLMENGFGLFFAAFYLQDKNLLAVSERILTQELTEQFTRTGAHFEWSPMYHAMMLHRILDCVNLAQNNLEFRTILLKPLQEKASAALGWLQNMTFPDGSFPMVNDSAPGISATTAELLDYGNSLGLKPLFIPTERFEPGYRMIKNNKYTLFVDAAPIGPDYQPGHAHSDSLQFLLHIGKQPILVDPGISTYEKNERRQLERSSKMHNTVSVNGVEQSDVWGGFRVGKRAKTGIWEEKEQEIGVALFAYEHLGVLYSRKWEYRSDQILLKEMTENPNSHLIEARYHFHPDIQPTLNGNKLEHPQFSVQFAPEVTLTMETYAYAKAWNEAVTAKVAVAKFITNNEVLIEIT